MLDKGHITIECPRLMIDHELADMLEGFIKMVRERPRPQPHKPAEPGIESLFPAKRKTTKRRR